jgi:hypothetical protein
VSTETAIVRPDPAQVLERVIIEGDLSRLSPAERVNYYNEVCRSVGLNPFTKPLEFLVLNNKLTLYALKNATDQLRNMHAISITKTEIHESDGYYTVVAYGKNKEGRVDSELGVVYLKNLQGEARANAMMKAQTKAKRRLTLSMCGLGFLDESEVDSIPEARTMTVDARTGEIIEARDLVRNADERVWQRYMHVLAEAQGLGIRATPLRLPLERSVLVDEGRRLLQLIAERKAELEPTHDELSEETAAALDDNVRLQQQAREMGVPGLRVLRAEPTWTLGKIVDTNGELEARIREREREQAAAVLEGQVELPG